MTTTPETPEQTITEAMNYVDELLAASQPAPYCGNDVHAKQIVEALRTRGYSLVGAPTEEQIERALDAWVGGDFKEGFPESLPYWEPKMRAALAAAGVAPQEPSECSDDGCLHYDHSPAPSPDREKLISEAETMSLYWRDRDETRTADLIDALAAAPVLDEAKLADVVKILSGPFDGTEGLDSFTLAWALGRVEALRGGGR